MGRAELLSFDEAHARLTYSPETGRFAIKKHMRCPAMNGRETHCLDTRGYVQVNLKPYGPLKGHRLAWLMVYGSWPVEQIDHINGVRDDNRIGNLRLSNHQLNAQNKRLPMATNKIGVLGVTFHAGRGYTAAVMHERKQHHIPGTFGTAIEAHAAYIALKRQLHEACTL